MTPRAREMTDHVLMEEEQDQPKSGADTKNTNEHKQGREQTKSVESDERNASTLKDDSRIQSDLLFPESQHASLYPYAIVQDSNNILNGPNSGELFDLSLATTSNRKTAAAFVPEMVSARTPRTPEKNHITEEPGSHGNDLAGRVSPASTEAFSSPTETQWEINLHNSSNDAKSVEEVSASKPTNVDGHEIIMALSANVPQRSSCQKFEETRRVRSCDISYTYSPFADDCQDTILNVRPRGHVFKQNNRVIVKEEEPSISIKSFPGVSSESSLLLSESKELSSFFPTSDPCTSMLSFNTTNHNRSASSKAPDQVISSSSLNPSGSFECCFDNTVLDNYLTDIISTGSNLPPSYVRKQNTSQNFPVGSNITITIKKPMEGVNKQSSRSKINSDILQVSESFVEVQLAISDTEPVLGLKSSGHIETDDEKSITMSDRTSLHHLPLSALLPHIHQLYKNEIGCSLLQQSVEKDGPTAASAILKEGMPIWGEAMIDPSGHHLFQKILEEISSEEKILLTKSLRDCFVQASMNAYGTKSVQKCIEVCAALSICPEGSVAKDAQSNNNTAAEVLTESLIPEVIMLCLNIYGNHVIHCMLQELPSYYCQLLIDAVSKNVCVIACHQHGCPVIKRCLDLPKSEARSSLVRNIAQKSLDLMQDAHGNCIVHYLLDSCNDEDVSQLCNNFIGSVGLLATQKMSSHVMEKCYERCTDAMRDLFLEELSNLDRIERMILDPLGNSFLLKALNVGTQTQAERLFYAMTPLLRDECLGEEDEGTPFSTKMNFCATFEKIGIPGVENTKEAGEGKHCAIDAATTGDGEKGNTSKQEADTSVASIENKHAVPNNSTGEEKSNCKKVGKKLCPGEGYAGYHTDNHVRSQALSQALQDSAARFSADALSNEGKVVPSKQITSSTESPKGDQIQADTSQMSGRKCQDESFGGSELERHTWNRAGSYEGSYGESQTGRGSRQWDLGISTPSSLTESDADTQDKNYTIATTVTTTCSEIELVPGTPSFHTTSSTPAVDAAINGHDSPSVKKDGCKNVECSCDLIDGEIDCDDDNCIQDGNKSVELTHRKKTATLSTGAALDSIVDSKQKISTDKGNEPFSTIEENNRLERGAKSAQQIQNCVSDVSVISSTVAQQETIELVKKCDVSTSKNSKIEKDALRSFPKEVFTDSSVYSLSRTSNTKEGTSKENDPGQENIEIKNESSETSFGAFADFSSGLKGNFSKVFSSFSNATWTIGNIGFDHLSCASKAVAHGNADNDVSENPKRVHTRDDPDVCSQELICNVQHTVKMIDEATQRDSTLGTRSSMHLSDNSIKEQQKQDNNEKSRREKLKSIKRISLCNSIFISGAKSRAEKQMKGLFATLRSNMTGTSNTAFEVSAEDKQGKSEEVGGGKSRQQQVDSQEIEVLGVCPKQLIKSKLLDNDVPKNGAAKRNILATKIKSKKHLANFAKPSFLSVKNLKKSQQKNTGKHFAGAATIQQHRPQHGEEDSRARPNTKSNVPVGNMLQTVTGDINKMIKGKKLLKRGEKGQGNVKSAFTMRKVNPSIIYLNKCDESKEVISQYKKRKGIKKRKNSTSIEMGLERSFPRATLKCAA